MRKYRILCLSLIGSAVILSSLAGFSMISLALEQDRTGIPAASRSNATPNDALPDEDESDSESDSDSEDEYASEGEAAPEFLSLQPEADETYTFCAYYFCYIDWSLELELGDEFDSEDYLDDTVDLYLDGPDGHMDDWIVLDVEWDLDGVDFSKEGEYTVTGTVDTGKCDYPVNWDNVPDPSFIINIVECGTGTISFQAETVENTVILNYNMNGKPFTLPYRQLSLYKSTDGGKKWFNITQSKQVKITENRITLSDISSDAMYQADTPQLGGYYSQFSDIAQVNAAGNTLSVDIIASGGEQGGEGWTEDDEHSWEEEPQLDGPYSIVGYGTGNPPLSADPKPLKMTIGKSEDYVSMQDYFSRISVFYADKEQDFWRERITLQAEWDWPPTDAVDWEQDGDTIVYGHISEEDKLEHAALLDFDTMPELTLSISVYGRKALFNLYPPEEVLYENNTVILEFLDDFDNVYPFEDTSGLTVWCSVDGGSEWYDITEKSNVSLTNRSLTVSHLKNAFIRNRGYTFQIEQTSQEERERFSGSSCVSHGIYGISFRADVGGDRGGGNRQDKPPKGLFDVADEDPGEDVPSVPLPPETEPVTEPNPDNKPEESTPPLESVPDETTNNTGNDENSDSGGSSNSVPKHNNISAGPAQDGTPGDPAADLPNTEEEGQKLSQPVSPRDISTAKTIAKVPSDATGTGTKDNTDNTTKTTPADSSSNDTGEFPRSNNPENNSTSTNILPEADTPSSHSDTAKIIIGITALLLGAAGGFWMIRRR